MIVEKGWRRSAMVSTLELFVHFRSSSSRSNRDASAKPKDMTEKERTQKQAEFAKRLDDFCKSLERDGFFSEECGCKSILIASTDDKINTMCVGDGPGLATMVAEFMVEDEKQAMVIDIAYNSFCKWLEQMGEDKKSLGKNVHDLLEHYRQMEITSS